MKNTFILVCRGIGSLHTLKDLVVTAKDIARAGEYLCVLTRVIADQCPDTKSKNDLYAYVERIKLYCHQLKITSAVKADTRNSTDETVCSYALVYFIQCHTILYKCSYMHIIIISGLYKSFF